MEWSYKKSNGKAKGTQGWEADREEGSLTYTGLWKGKRVVALLVVKPEDEDEEFSDMGKRLYAIGDEIVTACNAHAGLVERVKELEAWHANIIGAISTCKTIGTSHVSVPYQYIEAMGEDVAKSGWVNAGLVEALKLVIKYKDYMPHEPYARAVDSLAAAGVK